MTTLDARKYSDFRRSTGENLSLSDNFSVTHCWIQSHSWWWCPAERRAGPRPSGTSGWRYPPASWTVYCRLCSSGAADVRRRGASTRALGTWGDVWRWRWATRSLAERGWSSCDDHLRCSPGDRWETRRLWSPQGRPPPAAENNTFKTPCSYLRNWGKYLSILHQLVWLPLNH